MATRLDIVSVDQIGNEVTAEHFGGNLIYTKNNDETGAGNVEFWNGVDSLGVTNIRYPGGTVAETAIDIAQMPDGALDPRLVAFLEQLENDYGEVNGQPRKTILVLRTQEVSGETDGEWAENIERFTQTVIRDYGHLISAFQIGNEYWNPQGANLDEFSYGRRADLAAIAIQKGIDQSGSTHDPEIVVQMANAGTGGSAFSRANVNALSQLPFELLTDFEQRFLLSAAEKQGVEVENINTGWLWTHRIEYSNRAIFEQLSPQALEAIDAVVEHYYINDPIEDLSFEFTNQEGEYTSSLVSFIDQKYDHWSEFADKDLSLYVTEWGLSLTNEANHGIKEGSITLEQFEHMIKLGVKSAYAWPVVHNTEVSLGSRLRGGTDTDEWGITTENHRGTVFDLMSSTLIGLNQMDVTHLNPDAPFELNAFGDESRIVVYVSSRTTETEGFSFNLDALGEEFTTVSAVHIGYGETYAPGTTPHDIYAARWADEIDYATVDGEVLFFTDDNMGSSLTYIHEGALFKGRDSLDLTLKPFEMVQLVFFRNDGEVSIGGAGSDKLYGTVHNDILRGFEGDDIFVGDGGADRFEGGEGRDMADYGLAFSDMNVNLSWSVANTGLAKNDSYVSIEDVTAGKGDDKLTGNAADNRLLGGVGEDTLIGLDGDDVLFGGEDRDWLVGHRGDDNVYGGNADDFLFGDPGDDTLDGGKGNDHLTGGRGADVFIFRTEGGVDTITDYSLFEDQVQISGYSESEASLYYDSGRRAAVLEFSSDDRLEFLDISDIEALAGTITW